MSRNKLIFRDQLPYDLEPFCTFNKNLLADSGLLAYVLDYLVEVLLAVVVLQESISLIPFDDTVYHRMNRYRNIGTCLSCLYPSKGTIC